MSETASIPALQLAAVERRYRQGDNTLDILRGADLSLWPGQTVALIAPSGVGKSTLLHVAGLLERPDGGDVLVGDASTDRKSTRLNSSHIPLSRMPSSA